MNLAHYLGLLHRAEANLADAFGQVAEGHREEVDVHALAMRFAAECEAHADALRPFAERYGEEAEDEPDRLYSELFSGTRSGGLGLLRDLHDLFLMASEAEIAWTLVGQAAQAARDRDLLRVVERCEAQTGRQLKWLRSRMKEAAPQALVAA